MSEMTVNALTVDLLQDGSTVSLFKQGTVNVPGKANHTAITIQVPIATPGNQAESKLKRIAIEAATKALHEAIQTLEKHGHQLS